MRRFFLWLLVLLPVMLVVGCGFRTIEHRDDLNDPNRVTSVERKHSFFASENYLAYLEVEERAQASHERMFERAADELIRMHRETQWATPVEERLAAINLSRDLKELAMYRGTGREAPRVMVDQNWPAWGQLLLNGVQIGLGGGFNYRRTDSGQTIKGDGNVFVYKSGIGTGEGSQAQTYFGEYSPIDAQSSGYGSLYLDTSRPYSFYQDNSQTRTETYTDSPRKSDSSLF